MNNIKNITVIGSGLTALCTAALLAKKKYQITLITNKKSNKTDKRTTAILTPGIELLAEYKLDVENIGTPLKYIHISDQSAKYFGRTDLYFDSQEIYLKMFGRNIANSDLSSIFSDVLENKNNVKVIEKQQLQKFEIDGDRYKIRLTDSDVIKPDLILAADGHDSVCRKKLNIKNFTSKSSHSAIAFDCNHQNEHNYQSSEFILLNETITTIPLKGKRSAIVWIMPKEKISQKNDKTDYEKLSSVIKPLLGEIEIIANNHQPFAMMSQLARRFFDRNVILIGEAAHTLLPLGAQGFNLCLGDIGFILDNIEKTDSRNLGKLYQSTRRSIAMRAVFGVELLKIAFFSPIILPVGIARKAFIKFISKSRFWRSRIMQAGIHNAYR